MIKDGKYFTAAELLRSSTAEALDIQNRPRDAETIENINYIIKRLDIIREAWGKPIVVTSGYRCDELNKKVGGVKNSYHTRGLAADLKWDAELYRFIIDNFEFDEVIRETSNGGKTKWIHIQFRRRDKGEVERQKTCAITK